MLDKGWNILLFFGMLLHSVATENFITPLKKHEHLISTDHFRCVSYLFIYSKVILGIHNSGSLNYCFSVLKMNKRTFSIVCFPHSVDVAAKHS